MNMLAPEFSALITIFRSTGPVISTRRSVRSAGIGATVHSAARTLSVSGRKSGNWPESIAAWRWTLRSSSSRLRGPKFRSSSATKARASGLRISANSGLTGAPIIILSGITLGLVPISGTSNTPEHTTVSTPQSSAISAVSLFSAFVFLSSSLRKPILGGAGFSLSIRAQLGLSFSSGPARGAAFQSALPPSPGAFFAKFPSPFHH